MSRAISILVGVAAAHHGHFPVWSQPNYNQNGGGVTLGAGGYFTSWDSYWYLNAAQRGWPRHLVPARFNTTGFFPALPLALRAVHAVTGMSWGVTGFVVEATLELGTALVLSIMARRVLGERQANCAVVLFCLFPGAYIFSQVYSEPLFILATLICLYGLQRQWWWIAGLGASLAGATRSTGIILMVCCAWVALREIWLRRDWRSIVAPALSPIGMLAFFLFLKARTGTAKAYLLTQQQAWGQGFTVNALRRQFQYAFAVHKPPGNGLNGPSYAWVVLAFLLWGLIGLGLLGVQTHRRQIPSEWFLFSLGAIVVTVFSNNVGFRPRMALMAFPLILAYAGILKRWWVMIPAIAVCVAGLAYLSNSLAGYIP